MVQINQYRQTTTPQGSLIQPGYRSDGIGDALSGVGRAAADTSSRLVQAKLAKDERKAQTWYAETAPQMQSQILDVQRRALIDGPEDGDGITGRFLDESEKILQSYVKSAPNDRAREMLKIRAGEWLVGQKDKMVGEEFTRSQTYMAKAFVRGTDEAAKVVNAAPDEFRSMLQDMEFTLNHSPLSAEAKAELRDKMRLRLAGAAVAGQVNADPAGWLAADKSKDLAWNLLPLESQQALTDVAQKEVKFRASEAEAAITKRRQEAKREGYNAATESVLNGTPYSPPTDLDPYDRQQIDEYRQRLIEQERYRLAGGSIDSDPAYRDELLVMMSSNNKAPFLGHFIDKTRLSERDFTTFRTAQVKIGGDRTTRVSEVGPYVDRAMAENGLNRGRNAAQRATVWKMVMTDAVVQREDQLGRKLDDPELKALASETFRQTTDGDFLRSPQPTVKAINPQLGPIISGALRGTSVAITPANIVAIQGYIDEAAPQLDAELEARGIPVTAAARAELYMESYKAKFAQ